MDLLTNIKEEWKKHSIAEDKRELEVLLETMADDCVYELTPTGEVWRGKDQARGFYNSLWAAFPDVKFQLTNIVVGPQGVAEEAMLLGTHKGPWMGITATNRPVKFMIAIFFPWGNGKFSGERVYFDRKTVLEQLGMKA
jgi:steroid delta-isomerase-like uncharacterized protein